MKKSWTPQYRSSILYNPFFWGLGLVIVFIVCLVLSCIIKDVAVFGFLISYIYLCYMAYLERKRWDVGGYSILTLDSDSRLIIFDNKVRIPFRAITGVSLYVEEPPPRSWGHRGLKEHVNEFNGFLEFCLQTGDKITFAVQNREKTHDIIETLRDYGFAIYMSEADKYDVTGMYQIAYLLIFVAPVILWYLWKSFLR